MAKKKDKSEDPKSLKDEKLTPSDKSKEKAQAQEPEKAADAATAHQDAKAADKTDAKADVKSDDSSKKDEAKAKDADKATATSADKTEAKADAKSQAQDESKAKEDAKADTKADTKSEDKDSNAADKSDAKDDAKGKDSKSEKSSSSQGKRQGSGNGMRALFAGFILAFIAIGCTIGVLYVQSSTKDTITANRNERDTKLMQTMLPGIEKEAQGKITYDCRLVSHKLIGNKMNLYIAKDERNKTLGYIVSYSTNRGYSNPLIFIAGVNPDLSIRRVDVQLSKETPGLGDKVEQRKGHYMDQFVGKSLDNANWEVKKFNGEFDYFTGATVTSRAVVLATRDLLKGLQDIDIEGLPRCPVTAN